MVHALERARRHVACGGAVVCIQPHRTRRPFIAVRSGGRRVAIGPLINPVFQPLIDSADAAIAAVVARGLFTQIGRRDSHFRVRLPNPTQLHRYLHENPRPPRFRPGDKMRLLQIWRESPAGAAIEVTETMTVIGLRSTR